MQGFQVGPGCLILAQYISFKLYVDYIIILFSNHRSKLATAASFVNATDSRYGFSSKDLRKLGGSEVCRVKDLIETDHGT